MLKVDLNCDLGESFGVYRLGLDEKVIPLISSANIACGFHASDPIIMDKTVAMCQKAGVHLGAHPGYPDLVGFGRRNMAIAPAEVKAMLQYQVGALMAFAKAHGTRLSHVKPHGAMYNMASKDKALAQAICDGILAVDENLILLGLSGSLMVETAKEKGLRFANEVFADRAYEEDGTLVARTKPGAMIENENEAIVRVIRMVKEGKVAAITGKDIDIEVHSICVHGDGEHALLFVEKIRQALTDEHITIAPIAEVLAK